MAIFTEEEVLGSETVYDPQIGGKPYRVGSLQMDPHTLVFYATFTGELTCERDFTGNLSNTGPLSIQEELSF